MSFSSPSIAAGVALFLGAWLAIALWATLAARRRIAEASSLGGESDRLGALLKASPALPLILYRDGRIEGSQRLAHKLGLDSLPQRWKDFVANAPLDGEQAAALDSKASAAASAATSSSLILQSPQGDRIFRAEIAPAANAFGRGSVVIWFTDVTDSEQQMAQLRQNLERRSAALQALSGLIELAPFPIWHRGPDLALAMVNSAYVSAVEAETAAAVVRDGIELVEETVDYPSTAIFPAGPDGGQPLSRTVPITMAGERRMMQVVEVPLAGGGVAGYAIDVEDQEQARAELARFVRAQHDMLDRLSAGVVQFGRDRSLAFFNQPFARLFSLGADFLADRPEFDRVLDAMRAEGKLPEVRDFPEWKEAHRNWFTAGLAADEEDWLIPGGKHLRVVAQPLPDGGLLIIFEDRTEQIQLASARDTLLRVRSATFDNLFEAVGVFASDGRLNLWNNRFKELWGFEEEQLSVHPRIDSLTPHLAARLKRPSHAGVVRELVRSATQERKQRSGRVSLIDGREFEFAAVPLPDGNALFAMLDVTDSRKVEAALRERTEALEEADRLKTAFVSNMSYELRTPLTSIGGFGEMLAAGYAGELSPTAREYVAAILDSVQRLSALIDNVLDLTQSDMGSLLLAEDELDLSELCQKAADEARDLASKKSIDLAVEIGASVGTVTGDRRRLGQALANLLRNSLLYTEAGGRVLLHAEGDSEQARIVVSDNGRGIDPADQPRVFDRFHRTAEGRLADEPSVGLGLPLAKQFVEAHGGTVTLQSRLGQGTTVIVTLPRTAEQRAGYLTQHAAQ